jgi:hypothetical protein
MTDYEKAKLLLQQGELPPVDIVIRLVEVHGVDYGAMLDQFLT